MFRELETERLTLKNIGYEDADFMYKEFSTDAVNTYLYDAEPISSIEEANQWITFFRQEEPRDQHRWILVRKDSGEKIGTCGFHCLNRAEKTVEIGYDLQPAHWRKGYMQEALREVLRFAEKEMLVKHIAAHIAEGNEASIGLAKKLGFYQTEETYYEEFHGKKYLHRVYRRDFL